MMIVQSEPKQGKVAIDQMELVGRIIVLAIALLLMSRNLTGMFIGHREDNNATNSVFARNHIRYGLGYTKLFNVWENLAPSPEPYRYLNHPPLLSVWAAIPMLVFGDHEWVGRSVPIATTLAGAWILMVIVSRTQSSILSLLTGFFYVTLPITAYLGRMLCHESPVQFFSLLMLHGYLQWAGLYGSGYSRKVGAVYYFLGVVLGIGTGWAAVIMAGLIWIWNICRSFRDSSVRPLLLWLTMVPAVSLTAVFIHILWGSEWNIGWLWTLLTSRTFGSQDQTPWINRIWESMTSNFTAFGAVAAVIYLAIIPAILSFSGLDSPLRKIVPNKTSVMPLLLTLMQGIIWVVAFKHQSWMHEYWQYFLAPFFAASMAAIVLSVFVTLSRSLPRVAMWVTIFLIFLPIPSFAKSIDHYHQIMISQDYAVYLNNIARLYRQLSQFAPPFIPVMTSEDYQHPLQKIGSRNYHWDDPRVSYYANRPLVYTTDINDIEANRQGCAAYVLVLSDDPNTYRLAQQLSSKYKLGYRDGIYMFFLLNPGPTNRSEPNF
jgi:hypothetical protein